jgi:hypothetical protein
VKPTFTEAIGALLALGALAAVIVAALWFSNEQAQGALINLLLIAAGFFLRAKLSGPGGTDTGTTVTVPQLPPNDPVTVTTAPGGP